jgi:RNA polymerase primary sigma factor
MYATIAQEDHYDALSALNQFRGEAQRVLPLTDDEEATLLQQIQDREREARNRLVEAYQMHLLRLARRYAPRCVSLTLLDLVQEGNLGLLEALDHVDKWDGKRAFRAWALGWAQKRMTHAAWSSDGLVRMPDYTARGVARLARMRNALLGDGGHEPSLEELSGTSGLSAGQAQRLVDLQRPHIVSLERRLEQVEGELSVSAATGEDASVEMASALSERLDSVVRALPTAERLLLSWRFGLNDAAPQTLEQVAQRLHVSVTAARERERIALQRVRRALGRSGSGPSGEAA